MALLAALGASSGAAVIPAEAGLSSGRAQADPRVGPNLQEDARHRTDVLHFTPSRTAAIPLQAPRSAARVNTGTSANAGTVASGREVFGYAPYWALGTGSQWNYSTLTTVAYFGLAVKGDGSIDMSGTRWNGWQSGELTTIIDSAHASGDRVVLTALPFEDPNVSDAAEQTICAIVTSPTSTQTAITNLIGLVKGRAMDGVNVDFEGRSDPSCPAIQSGFTNFMNQLATQVHQQVANSQVSAATYSGSASWDGGIFNISQLGATALDFMFVMDYDMYTNLWNQVGDPAGPNAPINGWNYNDALSVRQYVGKAPASKVVLGTPFYGYKWSVTGSGPYAKSTSGPTAISYAGIVGDFACAQGVLHNWDYTAMSPWAAWFSPARNDPCGANFNSWRELYYDDATSLAIKYDLVNSYRLAGAGIWALGYDGGAPELWNVLASKFATAWPGSYHALVPARILDTRSSLGGHPGPLGSGQTMDVQVAGAGNVPTSGAAAVVVNVTVTQPSAPSYLVVYPSGSGRPTASNLNYVAGQTVANLVTVGLGTQGRLTVYNAAGAAHVIVDVAGWIATPGASTGRDGRFTPLAPNRLLDTRVSGGPLHANQSIDLQVAGRGNVPVSGVSAVAVNLTVTNPTAPSYLAAYPSGQPRPLVSNVNYVQGQTVPNRAVIALGSGGRITLYNAAGSADVIVDVNGWYSDSSAPASTAGQLTSVSPFRIVDTRIGVGVFTKLGSGATNAVAVPVAGIGSVPTMDAPSPPSSLILNVTVTNPTAPSYLSVYPGRSSFPATSDLNYVAGQTVPNLVIVQIGSDGTITLYNAAGATDVIVDVLGWFS